MDTEKDGLPLKHNELDLEDVIGSLPPLPPGASDDLDELIEEAIAETLFGENGKYENLRQ